MRHQKILGKLNMDFMMPEIVNENKINLYVCMFIFNQANKIVHKVYKILSVGNLIVLYIGVIHCGRFC